MPPVILYQGLGVVAMYALMYADNIAGMWNMMLVHRRHTAHGGHPKTHRLSDSQDPSQLSVHKVHCTRSARQT